MVVTHEVFNAPCSPSSWGHSQSVRVFAVTHMYIQRCMMLALSQPALLVLHVSRFYPYPNRHQDSRFLRSYLVLILSLTLFFLALTQSLTPVL